ncbi:unnamed protein product, partial [Mesorhabditis belari]|uniref:Potassium channel tetramerisation-type BTB domain-containing protein n=1 Tax=Mesorhabditis belari TaxID=2138241 RepID=A0AAF3EBJ6_9BILA
MGAEQSTESRRGFDSTNVPSTRKILKSHSWTCFTTKKLIFEPRIPKKDPNDQHNSRVISISEISAKGTIPEEIADLSSIKHSQSSLDNLSDQIVAISKPSTEVTRENQEKIIDLSKLVNSRDTFFQALLDLDQSKEEKSLERKEESSRYKIPSPNPFFWLTTDQVNMRAKSCGPIMKHKTPEYNHRMPHEFYDSNVIIYLEVGGKLYSSTLKTLANEQRNGRLLGGIIKKCVGWDKKAIYRVNCEKEHDSNGNYRYKVLLDRDREIFAYILRFLRYGEVMALPTDVTLLDHIYREADFFGMGKLKALVKKKIEDEREKVRARDRRDEQRDAAMKLLLEEIIRLRQEIEATRSNSEEEWQENIIL